MILIGHRHQEVIACKKKKLNTTNVIYIAVCQTLWYPEMGGLCINTAVISTWWNQNALKYLLKCDNVHFNHMWFFLYYEFQIVENGGK